VRSVQLVAGLAGVATLTPLRYTSYRRIARLSVDAPHPIVTLLEVVDTTWVFCGIDGGTESTRSWRAPEIALWLPASSSVAAASGRSPSANGVVRIVHCPFVPASAPPTPPTPLSNISTDSDAPDVPTIAGLLNLVRLSPTTPESLYDASAGTDGTGGGVVSTR